MLLTLCRFLHNSRLFDKICKESHSLAAAIRSQTGSWMGGRMWSPSEDSFFTSQKTLKNKGAPKI